eukprot:4708050-Lingulodinium_polyedra.AAC.1
MVVASRQPTLCHAICSYVGPSLGPSTFSSTSTQTNVASPAGGHHLWHAPMCPACARFAPSLRPACA